MSLQKRECSWLVYQLTGEYILDHHSASQCTPMYDTAVRQRHEPFADHMTQSIDLPRLIWSGEIVGHVDSAASDRTGIPQGVPVIGGTIDAWAEAVSVGAQSPSDLMLMFGTTMFLVGIGWRGIWLRSDTSSQDDDRWSPPHARRRPLCFGPGP